MFGVFVLFQTLKYQGSRILWIIPDIRLIEVGSAFCCCDLLF
uniref:Uncharacterized protein n=1 Tax=uncultured Desulfobacterium sp. TaxID=201089 RepID=E1YFI5_9BACT|nr:unknown protein [uncultured Desulfobacterium sp.]